MQLKHFEKMYQYIICLPVQILNKYELFKKLHNGNASTLSDLHYWQLLSYTNKQINMDKKINKITLKCALQYVAASKFSQKYYFM